MYYVTACTVTVLPIAQPAASEEKNVKMWTKPLEFKHTPTNMTNILFLYWFNAEIK